MIIDSAFSTSICYLPYEMHLSLYNSGVHYIRFASDFLHSSGSMKPFIESHSIINYSATLSTTTNVCLLVKPTAVNWIWKYALQIATAIPSILIKVFCSLADIPEIKQTTLAFIYPITFLSLSSCLFWHSTAQ